MHYNSHLSYCSRCSLRLRSTASYLHLLLHHQYLENCWGEALQLSFVRSSRLRLTASHLNYHWHLTQTLQHRICSVTLWPESANNNQSYKVWYLTEPNQIDRDKMLCTGVVYVTAFALQIHVKQLKICSLSSILQL